MTDQIGRKQTPLDEAIAAVRDDVPPPGVAEHAAARVWERLAPATSGTVPAVEAIAGCADVRALLPAYQRGELGAARALLVQDHLRECVTCRAAQRPGRHLSLLAWRPSDKATAAPPRSRRSLAIAASVLLAVAASAWVVREAFFGVPAGSRAAVQTVSGGLQRVGLERPAVLVPGAEVGEAEPVRTARASRAVLRLRDGSVVEMGERAELSVTARGNDTTIHLTRGSIIVQAAKRRRGHLRVASGDCTVSVTGTVFSVNHGLKGSRVSVFDGQVQVAGLTEERTLAPGDQWASGASMETVPLRDEIAWSADVDRHLAMLGEVKVLRERMRALPTPALRYESAILRVLPADTVVYAAAPNYGQTLADAHRLFQERLQESPVLREWWTRVDPSRHGGPDLGTVIEKVRSFSSYLGDEVVLAAMEPVNHRDPAFAPLLVAEVRKPGLREFLETEMAQVSGPLPVRILGEGPTTEVTDHLFVLLRPELMAVSVDAATLRRFAAHLDGGAAGLETTPFGARVAESYTDGAGLVFAADLQTITARITAARPDARREDVMKRAGLDGLRYLVFERKTAGDAGQSEAVLAFDGAPRGVVSWLAAPAPMGALDFVSPSAQGAMAVVAKSPALIFDDILAIGGRHDGAREGLGDLERELDLHVRTDLAQTLGGEAALALDGPLLPTPAWKVVIEVNDPVRLQTSLETLARRAADEAEQQARQGRPMGSVTLESEDVDGHTFHVLRGRVVEVHYTFADGYLVAAPSRALVMRALQVHDSGDTLARSAAFRALFPPDRDINVSGLVYQNLAPMVRSLMDAPGAGALSETQRSAVDALARDARPSILCAYGEPGAIRLAGLGGVFDLDTSELALPVLLERLWPGTRATATP